MAETRQGTLPAPGPARGARFLQRSDNNTLPLTTPFVVAGRLPAWQRRWAVGVLGILVATVLVAVAVPIGVQGAMVPGRGSIGDEAISVAGGEDLTAFLDTKRWGRSLREIQAEAAAAGVGPRLNPVLAGMGYVGLIVTEDRSAMLLRLADGTVKRLQIGDRTPDGRVLSSVTDNTLTLRGRDGMEEVLELFPRHAGESGS